MPALQPTGGSRNQGRWGQPYQYHQSPNNKLLFALPDTTVPDSDRDREGCGLRTALIRFQ